ncbi:ATP-dependent endonuclease [Curtobacterium sp. 1310]|uniref:ATP-dependent nuclease n=1 Tax=Curtobacterium sp. 1310 TaxID=2806570 RepID=UPI001AE40AA4|nr:AAA family ATPase [Curtobacterium sp. 1310]MBP1301445.1 energy-coupling factor transporter ATP-binding protein EcfA2 [Curtobacterium sp. 1310]
MRLDELRVRNYRTVGAEQTLRLASGTTLVGPNNSGKTNLLRAVQLFFTGYDNSVGYKRSTDFTFGAGSQRTSLVATFTADGHSTDLEILSLLDELHAIVNTERESDTFSVNLYFAGKEDTAVYRVFGNTKVPNEVDRPAFSRKQKQLVESLLRQFKCHYVPSAKSIDGLYNDLLHPFLADAAYEAIAPHMSGIKSALKDVAVSLNDELAAVGLTDIRSSFALDTSVPAHMLAGFDLNISDPGETPLSQKGQGIQSTALFASFAWITKQEKKAGFVPIWLIEEPESYLHPELSKAVHKMLNNLAKESLVLSTTHALAFVPVDVGRVQGVELDKTGRRTVISKFETHMDATRRIRDSLGVQFADYYNLSAVNVFVEGPSDRELIHWAIKLLDADGSEYPLLARSLVEEFGGVKQLEGFLKATFEPITRERALVSVFDGDLAGQNSRQALQQFFGQKSVDFKPNLHFVSIRNGFAIEGLFPDAWMIEMHDEHGGWFETYSVDSAGDLEPFRISSGKKANAIGYLRARAEMEEDLAWSSRWASLLGAVEGALAAQSAKLGV